MNVNSVLMVLSAILYFLGFIDFEKTLLSFVVIACFILNDICKELKK